MNHSSTAGVGGVGILAGDESRQMRRPPLLGPSVSILFRRHPQFDLCARELRNDTALMYTHADGGAGGAVYVWPQRLTADVVVQATNERHYRRRRDLVWHPHPSYQLTLQDGSSWGRLDLEPAGDDQLFVSGRADVVQLIDEANNVSSSMKPDDWRPLRGCFYRGQVVQHPPHQQTGAAAPGRDSKVVLSLCHGLSQAQSLAAVGVYGAENVTFGWARKETNEESRARQRGMKTQ
ncbi:hypothetical protein DAPPUDRAFT_102258 [Daphnia pulex]|uniref:Uncharacterized protein n=1 Tax=Daphnia pulex TaxID=6669 RepID=E9GFV7_DAPPU|nr:hypothetical protein DAPPUDRAFT_102258 [Daphnia pulex]|eukprot:EFX81743.1 hypothetical protein DAPPUDRAFT_102258 [Daphnia pulex]